MSIAIMVCRKVIGKCAGSGCFKAYNRSEKAFERYKEAPQELGSFFYCSGCEDTLSAEGENWQHKMKQIKKNGVATVHLSHCIKSKCHRYESHETILKQEGFEVVHGSH